MGLTTWKYGNSLGKGNEEIKMFTSDQGKCVLLRAHNIMRMHGKVPFAMYMYAIQ